MKLTNMVFLTRFLAGKVSHQLDFEIVGHRNVDRNLAKCTFGKNIRLKSHHIFLKFTSGVFLTVYLMSVHLRWKSDIKSVPIQNPVKHLRRSVLQK